MPSSSPELGNSGTLSPICAPPHGVKEALSEITLAFNPQVLRREAPVLEENPRCTVQGAVALSDSGLRTGGFVCCPGSHSNQGRSSGPEDFKNHAGDTKGGPAPKRFFNDYRHVPQTAGSLVLWDSRTVRQGVQYVPSSKLQPLIQC